MLATFKQIPSGKRIKINVGLIITVEEHENGLNIAVEHPDQTRVYHVEGNMDTFDAMMLKSIYGDVIKQLQQLQTQAPTRSSSLDPDFLTKLGINPDDEEGPGGATMQ